MNTTAPVIALDHPAALDVARVGRKAADLAAARAAGLPAAPGVVLTSGWATDDRATAEQVWRIISHDGARPLVVRPSAIERPVHGRPADDRAIEHPTVVRHAGALLTAIATLRAGHPTLPVLVQPELRGPWKGVLFGDDAARGWRARRVVVARAADGHEPADWIGEVDHTGRVRAELSRCSPAAPPAAVLARLGRLDTKVASAFDGPQDLDWIADGAGRLHVLRVRAVVRLSAGLVPGRDEIVTAA
jgi:pyruvate,water dikinase